MVCIVTFKVNLIINKVVFHLILTFGIFCVIGITIIIQEFVVSVIISKLYPLAHRSLKSVYNDVVVEHITKN